jgi:hypothetical protein
MRWSFDRLSRLEALGERLKAQAKYLRFSSFDLPRGSSEREIVVRRLELVERRIRRLADVARHLRRQARESFA